MATQSSATTSKVDVRRPMKMQKRATEGEKEEEEARSQAARDDDDDDDDEMDGPEKPQKRHFRTRAHSNVLNANDFWFPATPDHVPVDEYFPKYGKTRPIEFVDIGCGYGSLLFELAKPFPTELMLGIEIRPKVVEYVQRRVLAERHDAKKKAATKATTTTTTAEAATDIGDGSGSGSGSGDAGASSSSSSTALPPPDYENLWAVHNNAQRFMPNFFRKGQLTKLFFCFADPHFKKRNHRKRIVSEALLAEYAYVMGHGALAYVITDVSELMMWMVEHFSASPLFERLDNESLRSDPAVKALIRTDEGLKVTRNNGNMYIAVFRKRDDPLAPMPTPIPNDNKLAAAAASDAGYTPKAGGERRGMTW